MNIKTNELSLNEVLELIEVEVNRVMPVDAALRIDFQ